MLRREIAGMLLRGDLRDPRIQPIAAISITAVRVAPDLGSARVFVDALGDAVNVPRVLAGLNAGAGAIRAALGPKLNLKRTPSLRFERDDSVDQGRTIERVLAEIATETSTTPEPPPTTDADDGEADDGDADDGDDDDDDADDGDADDGDADDGDADAPATSEP
jgi:ribosome-binding factor A